MSKSTKYLLVALLSFMGISVLATTSLPFTFQAGQPIKADEVNANFAALADALNTLETNKQTTITTTPCGDGQFVTGVAADGNLTCGIDQIGSAGSSGVSSLNGKTGSLAIEGGNGVTVETLEDGKVVISAGSSSSGDFSPQAIIPLPSSGTINTPNPAFAVTNNGGIALSGSSPNGAGVYAFSGNTGNGVSAYSEKNYGVLAFTNTGVAGVYGESKTNGATGVRGVNSVGPGSSGVWGESAAGRGVRGNSTTGSGIEGSSTSGFGVKGTVSTGGYGVYGESASTGASVGVGGRANSVNSVGVNGLSNQGTGVQGTSTSGIAVRGKTTSGTAGVYGETGRSDGSGVQGVCTNSVNCAGVYGVTTTGVGVWGRNRSGVAIRADGNAVQELGFGGFAKAMVVINNGTIARCYNGVTGASSGGCGFSSSRTAQGRYAVNFGFDVSTRFYSTNGLPTNSNVWRASILGISGSTLSIVLQSNSGSEQDGNFSLIVF